MYDRPDQERHNIQHISTTCIKSQIRCAFYYLEFSSHLYQVCICMSGIIFRSPSLTACNTHILLILMSVSLQRYFFHLEENNEILVVFLEQKYVQV